jgi:hypothetical protein
VKRGYGISGFWGTNVFCFETKGVILASHWASVGLCAVNLDGPFVSQ